MESSFFPILLITGEVNSIEMLMAQQKLPAVQLDQISDKLQQLQSASNLYRVLEGGLK
ncbi:MAG: hypothetical protein LBV72_10865 [Tannerella sp.]|nr:hypothetical protein [Tannerella sp.]